MCWSFQRGLTRLVPLFRAIKVKVRMSLSHLGNSCCTTSFFAPLMQLAPPQHRLGRPSSFWFEYGSSSELRGARSVCTTVTFTTNGCRLIRVSRCTDFAQVYSLSQIADLHYHTRAPSNWANRYQRIC